MKLLTRRFALAGLLGIATPVAAAAATQTVAYTYDAIGRLTSVTYDDTLTVTYTYDAGGNITSIVVGAGTVSVPPPGGQPGSLALGPAQPTPFRGATTLRFELPGPSRLRLAVFDLSGRLVRTLAEGHFAAGQHSAAWDGRDERGARVGNGLYFARLETASGARTRRIVRLD